MTHAPSVQIHEPSALQVTSLCEAFQRRAAVEPDAIALRTPEGETEITWREYARRVEQIAAGLAALGVERGDAVALMMANRPEFNICDTAAMHLGATPFSIYNTLPVEQIVDLLSNAGSRILICEQRFAAPLLETGRLEHVVCVDSNPPGALSLDELQRLRPVQFDFEQTWRAVEPDDVLTLIYTSGTTGPPKGVELTHANMLAQLRAFTQVLPVVHGDRCVSYLPSAHIADRLLTHYFSVAFGAQITSVADAAQLPAALLDARPTIWAAVPRIWEKLKAAIDAVPEPARGPKLRVNLGLDQVRWSVSGAAPIAIDLLEQFAAIGLPICELWGMSELSAVGTINPPDAIRFGTVGVPLPGVEIALADDGELLCRGPVVMRGYRGEPEKTAATIDADGWLHTGDIAEIDADGYVRIIDRKKELIINAYGKNMSPANIEATLKAASPLIGQAVAIGDRRPYNTALIVLDPNACAAYAEAEGLGDPSVAALSRDPRVADAIAGAVAQANERLARVERIRRYTILADEWQLGGEQLTPTMKLKRKQIARRYREEIEAMYR